MKDPLLSGAIPHAYALIADPNRPQKYFAVHLVNVSADQLEHLERSQRSDAAPWGLLRIQQAMEARHRRKGWDR